MARKFSKSKTRRYKSLDRIKICIVSHTYPTKKFPAQATFIKNEAHLVAESHEVEVNLPAVYAFPFQKQFYRTKQPDELDLPVNRVSYLSFPGRRLASITKKSLSNRLIKLIEKQKPNIVHLHWLYPAGLAAAAIKKAGYLIVLTLHGGDWYSNVSNKKLMPLLEKSLLACDRIICVGKTLTKDVSNYNSLLHNKLVHIPHGIDTDLFYPTPKQKKVILKQLEWSTEKLNILCVANLYHGKGIDLLIEAFASINKKKDCHLHIISPTGNKVTKSNVNALIDQYSLHQYVTFYGSQKQKKLADFYRATDLLVSPSRREGFGLAVAEAIACGTPVLATRSGGPDEIINNDCGILVDSNSAENLSKGLTTILNTLGKYQADKMHKYINNNYSILAKKKKLLSVYDEITN